MKLIYELIINGSEVKMGWISKIFFKIFYIELTEEEIELEKLKKKPNL
jgi:hypothetical protein